MREPIPPLKDDPLAPLLKRIRDRSKERRATSGLLAMAVERRTKQLQQEIGYRPRRRRARRK
jgi:hypothetical protein